MSKIVEMSEDVKEPIAEYLTKNELWTYADYLVTSIQDRFEIIKGKMYKMSPAPNVNHQAISREVSGILYNFFKEKECQLFIAPFDVRLIDPIKKSKKDKDITSVVQPDVCVICDKEKLDEKGCIGSPDLVIEILSPSNNQKELDKKFSLYEENKVKEYWIIQPSEKAIWLYTLENERFIGSRPRIEGQTFQSNIFSELTFSVRDIFPK